MRHEALPFNLAELPDEVRDWVAKSLDHPLFIASALQAIEDYAGERTVPLVLAQAWVRWDETAAGEDVYEASHEVLMLLEEARRLGASNTPVLQDLAAQAEEAHEEAWERRQRVEDVLSCDPATLPEWQVREVAYELYFQDRFGEAIPWFERLVALHAELEPPQYGQVLARCRYMNDEPAAARANWERVLEERAHLESRVVQGAWVGVLLTERDGARFRQRFQEALAWAQEAGMAFPLGMRDRLQLLWKARGFRAPFAVDHVIRSIEESGEYLPRALREEIAAWRA